MFAEASGRSSCYRIETLFIRSIGTEKRRVVEQDSLTVEQRVGWELGLRADADIEKKNKLNSNDSNESWICQDAKAKRERKSNDMTTAAMICE